MEKEQLKIIKFTQLRSLTDEGIKLKRKIYMSLYAAVEFRKQQSGVRRNMVLEFFI